MENTQAIITTVELLNTINLAFNTGEVTQILDTIIDRLEVELSDDADYTPADLAIISAKTNVEELIALLENADISTSFPEHEVFSLLIAGEMVDSHRANAISSMIDWSDIWPMASWDANKNAYTYNGSISEGVDGEGNINDRALVSKSELATGDFISEGYVLEAKIVRA